MDSKFIINGIDPSGYLVLFRRKEAKMTPENQLKQLCEYLHPGYARHLKIKTAFVVSIIILVTLTLILLI